MTPSLLQGEQMMYRLVGDDIITTTTNLALGDRIDGGNGTDTFEVIHTGLATIPTTANLVSIEALLYKTRSTKV